MKMKHPLILISLFVPGLLLLANLGGQFLWQDEAQTACISRTVATRGLPYGYDGKNFFSQEVGVEYGKNYIWKWHTWLPFYVTAAAYKVFGVSTLSARLPFALCGIATVFLIFFAAAFFFPTRHTGLIAATLLSLCVPFLILSRQCRYYSMAALFFTAALCAYALLLRGKKGSGVFLVISLTLLFQTQYIYFFTLSITFVLHAILFDRIRLKPLLLFLLIAALINLPWMIWLSSMRYADRYGSQVANPQRIFSFFLNYCSLSFRQLLFPLLAVFPVLYIFFYRIKQGQWPRPEKSTVSHLSLLLLSFVVPICVLSVVSPAPFFRYLAPLIPAMIIVVAYIVSIMVDIHWIAVILAVLVVVLQWPIGKFIHEITHDFKGPMDGIVSYLNAHGSANDTVAITYEDMPLKFYTKMRVVGGLTGENLAPALNARWVIFRKYTICEKDFAVRNYLLTNLNRAHYRKIVINYPDTPFENREEPAEHLYSTAIAEDRVVIYERIN